MKQTMLTNEELGSLTMSLGHLIRAGVSSADALYLLSADETDALRKKTLEQMSGWADEGSSLADCLTEAKCFPEYLCTLVRVGQRVGRTEQTLMSLSRYYQVRASLQRQLRSALVYPTVLLGVVLAVLVVLLVWVLPVFEDVYARLGSGLTGLAAVLLSIGQILGRWLPLLGVVLAGAGGCILIPGMRTRLTNYLQRKLGDSGVFGLVNSARFVQALSMAVSSGMTDLEAAELASELATGQVPRFRQRCEICMGLLDRGDSLAKALRDSKILPPAECRLLEAGSRSGQGEAALENIAQRLLQRSEDELAASAQRIEPVMVLVACAMIGLVLMSVMLPLINIMTAIG